MIQIHSYYREDKKHSISFESIRINTTTFFSITQSHIYTSNYKYRINPFQFQITNLHYFVFLFLFGTRGTFFGLTTVSSWAGRFTDTTGFTSVFSIGDTDSLVSSFNFFWFYHPIQSHKTAYTSYSCSHWLYSLIIRCSSAIVCTIGGTFWSMLILILIQSHTGSNQQLFQIWNQSIESWS